MDALILLALLLAAPCHVQLLLWTAYTALELCGPALTGSLHSEPARDAPLGRPG